MKPKTTNPPAKPVAAKRGLEFPGSVFDEFFKGWPGSALAKIEPELDFFPDMDLVEKKKEYLLKLDVPGMSEEQLDIEVNNRVLTVSGKSEEEIRDPEDKDIVRERRVTSFRRSFTVPDNVDAAKIDAAYKKGVLEIKLPKAKEAIANARKVAIK